MVESSPKGLYQRYISLFEENFLSPTRKMLAVLKLTHGIPVIFSKVSTDSTKHTSPKIELETRSHANKVLGSTFHYKLDTTTKRNI